MNQNTNVRHLQLSNDGAASITSQAYARMRVDILAGDLVPGRKLKIDELRNEYGIGASPIRGALSLLTSDGLVDRIDQRGFQVKQVSRQEFEELLKTRCWLEERALRESIAHADRRWEESIVLAHYRLGRVPRSDTDNRFSSNPEWEAHHKVFHHALISACASGILLKICDQLYDHNIRYRQIAGPSAYPGRTVGDEHEAIMAAALDLDADLAVQQLIDHYAKTGAFVAERLN